MKQRYYVFIPNMNGGWITRRFDTEEEAREYAGQFFESYVKKM
jgi:hypothetical protein